MKPFTIIACIIGATFIPIAESHTMRPLHPLLPTKESRKLQMQSATAAAAGNPVQSRLHRTSQRHQEMQKANQGKLQEREAKRIAPSSSSAQSNRSSRVRTAPQVVLNTPRRTNHSNHPAQRLSVDATIPKATTPNLDRPSLVTPRPNLPASAETSTQGLSVGITPTAKAAQPATSFSDDEFKSQSDAEVQSVHQPPISPPPSPSVHRSSLSPPPSPPSVTAARRSPSEESLLQPLSPLLSPRPTTSSSNRQSLEPSKNDDIMRDLYQREYQNWVTTNKMQPQHSYDFLNHEELRRDSSSSPPFYRRVPLLQSLRKRFNQSS